MNGLWTYPWSLSDESSDTDLQTLEASGINRFKIAAHYHSVRTLDPQSKSIGFDIFPGGPLFEPDASHYDQTPIRPNGSTGSDVDGSFETAIALTDERGFDVDAWVVCLHGSKLASEWPEYRTQDVFGGTHSHAFCPSNPEVREYLAGVIADVAAYGVDRIDLESVGFPSVFHDHGVDFGHHKDHAVTTRTEEFLLSQCFCNACRREAESVLDFEAAHDLVEDLSRQSLRSPEREVPPLAVLLDRHPLLNDLFEFREDVIELLLAGLAGASGDVALNYYLADGGGYTPEDLWPAGVTPELLETYLDDVTVLCYTADTDVAERRLSAASESLNHNLDAGVTLDPAVVADRDHWHRLSTRVNQMIDGDLFVYNHALMTNAHFEWLSTFDEQYAK